jgi:hypothetical protein
MGSSMMQAAMDSNTVCNDECLCLHGHELACKNAAS